MNKEERIMNNEFKPADFEAKWQEKWEDAKIFSPDVKTAKNPYFNLMMFPYPSAEGLHVGNMYAFTGADVYAKFQRMQGKDVLEPIGLDGFGIHSENYAMKVGRHPMEQAQIAEKNFYRQLRSIGNSFDWQRTIETYDPNYYKWTQWLFTLMFKNGLAYRKKAQVNWCPSDKTVLSDEQVIDGKCERCSSLVEKKELEQWFFRITKYADRLLYNLTHIDWAEKVKIAQKQWIGKSEGLIFEAPVKDTKLTIQTFSAHFEAFYADTFVVIAPDHPFLEKLLEGVPNKKEIEDFCKMLVEKRKNEKEDEEKEPEGISTGRYIVDPIGNGDLPIWVANFALKDYGTGIVKCSAHDTRDFAFAKKYNIRLKPVLFPENPEEKKKVENLEICYTDMEEGVLSEPEVFKGKKGGEVRQKVIEYAQDKGFAQLHYTYHLRDWLISRQRYWGPPIPIIYCSKCWESSKFKVQSSKLEYGVDYTEIEGVKHMIHAVPEEQLPVLLPDVQDWRPEGNGLSPLANHPEFYNTKCPGCGADAKRETDVSDTFLDSAWYFLRYPSTDIESVAFDTDITKKWLPVDMYIGGAEHSVLHLLYARFVTMVLKDLKFIDFEEPFTRFFAHGLIIKDGAKMSKSKGNVVVPDEYIKKYGSDALRTYLMFLGPYEAGGDFSDSGIQGVHRFLKRVWTLITDSRSQIPESEMSSEAKKMMHKSIKRVTSDMGKLSYNTSIAALMEWYNFIAKQGSVSKEEVKVYLQLLAPFAPHMTEELWQILKSDSRSQIAEYQESGIRNQESIHLSKWPEFDETLTQDEELVIVVQVNGKRRGEIVVQSSKLKVQSEVEEMAREKVASHLEGFEVKKVVYIQGKIINFVI